MTRQEKFEKVEKLCQKLFLSYDTNDFELAQFLLSELRIEFAELRFKQRK